MRASLPSQPLASNRNEIHRAARHVGQPNRWSPASPMSSLSPPSTTTPGEGYGQQRRRLDNMLTLISIIMHRGEVKSRLCRHLLTQDPRARSCSVLEPVHDKPVHQPLDGGSTNTEEGPIGYPRGHHWPTRNSISEIASGGGQFLYCKSFLVPAKPLASLPCRMVQCRDDAMA